ncbi:MAG TPA: hypothetical protein VHG51_13365 [Longimicrobiaceae bacterium]|nr:hypothetical protein [Longimicrobiaceae bacterium]
MSFSRGGRRVEAVLLSGIQASGKTTFHRDRFFDTHVRIGRAALRRGPPGPIFPARRAAPGDSRTRRMHPDAAPRRSRTVLAWLLATQSLSLVSLIAWAASLGSSLMAVVPPDAAANKAAWVFVAIVWSYPLLPVGCSVAAWGAFVRGRRRRAAVLSAVPVVPALPLLLYLFWAATPA